jgi:hypothetical protein
MVELPNLKTTLKGLFITDLKKRQHERDTNFIFDANGAGNTGRKEKPARQGE